MVCYSQGHPLCEFIFTTSSFLVFMADVLTNTVIITIDDNEEEEEDK